MPGADVSTFETIGRHYGVDKNSVYCMNEKTDFDRKTFTLTGSEAYCKDKSGVYFLAGYNGKKSTASIKGADPESFQEIFYHQEIIYAKDKNHVYMDSKIIPGADPETFKVFKNSFFYAKDKNHVYSGGNILEETDPANFDPDRQ